MFDETLITHPLDAPLIQYGDFSSYGAVVVAAKWFRCLLAAGEGVSLALMHTPGVSFLASMCRSQQAYCLVGSVYLPAKNG
jgi:hypothetical protein